MSGGILDLPPEQGGPPNDEAKRLILDRGSAALEGLVDAPHREEVVRRVLHALPVEPVMPSGMQITATRHVGPVPAPETVEHYESILPGSADRMFAMAERDQRAEIASNTRSQWLGFSFNVIALVAGVLGLGAILGATIYLADHGHENAAIALVGLGISGVVGAFVNARWKKSD